MRLSGGEGEGRLSLPTSTLANQATAAKAGKLADVAKTYRPLTDVEMEPSRARRESADVKMERALS